MPEGSYKVYLPDGRMVDICTQAGADAFLLTQTGGDFKFFSSNIDTANKIRSKRRPDGNDNGKLDLIYVTVDCLAENSTSERFSSAVPQSEVQVWLDHVISELRKITADQRWIGTGQLKKHDASMLSSCVSMFMNAVPVALAFESDFFQVLAELVAARKGTNNSLPSFGATETIELIVSNAVIARLFDSVSPWTGEKIFKKLEASGVLLEFIRCTTVPQPHDSIAPCKSLLKAYDELLKCTSFLKKNFKKGKPCGDLVFEILKGMNGYKRTRKIVVTKLNSIARWSELMQSPAGIESLKMCRKCNKVETSEEFQNSLMQCSRCRMAHYCSKECQIADWKSHKAFCRPAVKADVKTTAASQSVVQNFAKKHYVDIMVKLVSVCDSTGLKKGELLLELDFVPDKKGRIPALQSPPKFKIKESRGYFECSRPNEPDWFYKKEDPEVYRRNIKSAVALIRDQYHRLTPSQLLCFLRKPDGHACYKIQLMGDTTGVMQLFDDESVAAFKSAINDDDFNPLTRIFDADRLRTIRRELGMNHGIGMPDEEQIGNVRGILNSMFGANF